MHLKLTGNKYKYKHCIGIATIILAVLFLACNDKKEARAVQPAFYYWKSVFKLSNFEKKRLDSLKVKTIYIKFFDVDWDAAGNAPVPVAKLQTKNNKYNNSYLFAPVIFISNECIKKIDTAQIEKLVSDIHQLVQDIINANSFNNIAEIQFDCDWTASTREKYFQLLRGIKKVWINSSPISATIRLHQIKFISKTGVPPVDKGLLMCYNMGNLKNPATKNSVIETEELKKYVNNLASYPLPLDIGLPLFDWKVLYRNNVYSGLIENLPGELFSNSFVVKKDNRFSFLKDTVLAGYDFKKGDVLRDEQSSYDEILSAAAEINKRLKNTRPMVSLYHLDSVILNKYTLHELETIYNSLR